VFIGTPVPAHAQLNASMTVKGTETVAVGGTFTAEIYVNTTTSVNAVQADLTYPANLLEYQSVSSTGSAFNADLISNVVNGSLSFVRAKIGGGSGTMLVATVTFKGLKDGRAEIKMLDTSMATDSETSENVVGNRQGLIVTIGNATADTPIETGTVPTTGNATPTPGGSTSGSPTPTIDPSLDDIEPTVSGNEENKKSSTTTFLGGGESGGISNAAWALLGMSLLLLAASIFFSINILKRRSRRAAAYQNYMQPPVNPMYSQGSFYDLNNAGYTTRSYPQNPYQQPVTPSRPGAYPSPYSQQYPMRQGYPQAGAQPGSVPAHPQNPYQQTMPPPQNNQYPW
jgi:hypothetical protein